MPRLLSKRIVFDVKKVLMLYSENIQYAIKSVTKSALKLIVKSCENFITLFVGLANLSPKVVQNLLP